MYRFDMPMLAAIALLAVAQPTAGWADSVKIASLEWPPYSGEGLPELGTSIANMRAAFAAAGTEASFEILPWERAVRAGTEEAGYAGYGPEYYDVALDVEAGGSRCLFSKPYNTGPLGLVEAVAKPVSWANVADLGKLTIGTVSGYLNTPEFDKAVADGTIKVDEVQDDATNIRKVAAGRVDAAVIDAKVLGYLLETDPKLGALAAKLRMNDHLLADKTLHICFRNDAEGAAARAQFHKGLAALGLGG
jgi:polar amino acid transport system substrate-binding protein